MANETKVETIKRTITTMIKRLKRDHKQGN